MVQSPQSPDLKRHGVGLGLHEETGETETQELCRVPPRCSGTTDLPSNLEILQMYLGELVPHLKICVPTFIRSYLINQIIGMDPYFTLSARN